MMQRRRSVLFVIAIDKYGSGEFGNLNNSVADAKAIIDLLTNRYGFELDDEPLFDAMATKENIIQRFNRLLLTIEENDNLVIYYSGHGRMHTVGRQGYWIPSDAKDRISDFIDNSSIKDFIERIPSKHTFLISDSCFSGTFLTQTRAAGNVRSYSDLDMDLSRWMLASGGEETVSDGPSGQHSPFAHYLIHFLEANDNKYTSVKEIIRYVTIMVQKNSRQHPNGAPIENIGHQGGQMVFILKDHLEKTARDKSRGLPNCRSLSDEIKAYEPDEDGIPTGKEILLIESFITAGEILIMELFRFNDEGQKKNRFADDALQMEDKNGEKTDWKVIRRFASWQGFTRFWDASKQKYEGKNPYVLRADESIDNVEVTEVASDYRDYLKDLMDGNPEILRCLHCNEMISSNDSSLVEIDEEGLRPAIGNVHNHCLRPLDRIIGNTVLQNGISNLVSFDKNKWIELLKKGQFFWKSALFTSQNKPIWNIVWNREHINNTGEYCIKQTLSDGTTKYIRLGREIHRFTTNEIDSDLEWFKQDLEQNERQGDPLGYTDKLFSFGKTSLLNKIKQPDETILKVISIEKAKYSRQIESENTAIDYDYAPVGFITEAEGMQVLNLGNCIPIIFDPLLFEELHKNWNDAGYKIGPCEIKILENDREFDLFLQNAIEDGMQPIAHPMFDMSKELASGVIFIDIRDLKKQSEQDENFSHSYSLKSNPDWQEGDRVRIIFTDPPPHSRIPEGILVSGEFVDEKGESCALFCPIENGRRLLDLTFKLPVRLLERMTVQKKMKKRRKKFLRPSKRKK